MPKLILQSGTVLQCRDYSPNGIDFTGGFSDAKMTDRILQSDGLVQLKVDHGEAVLMDLTGYEYTGTMIVHNEGVFTACLTEKQIIMSAEDAQGVRIAKILLGDET
jgi:hypothetical protein